MNVSRILASLLVLAALLAPVAIAPFCQAATMEPMPCCEEGKGCDTAIRMSSCCRLQPDGTPAVPNVALVLSESSRRPGDGLPALLALPLTAGATFAVHGVLPGHLSGGTILSAEPIPLFLLFVSILR